MNIQKSMISGIFKDISFSQKEITQIESKFEKLTLKKGDTLLNAGKTVNHQYFINSGCLRTYFVDNSAKDHIIQFAIKDWWISDYTAFFTSSKAIMTIDCIQDASVCRISKVDMESLYIEIPRLETFFRKKMEGAFAGFQKRIIGNLSQSTKEKYSSFISTYPNIEQSVKNYHIASYLGVTTETLSRVRKKLVQK
ncbi:Crp/Fnr family transcriptional regulator [Psychroserpens jangbogonensis]|uniref:Crp/Fnr family transcriptional regulator n=1 Tax=Psychroserpens jangbogonensis TaxID=1484460 RepID=UPI00053D26FF|nr:Crp/Fnr family transcriptional regulator [Psychroserpens jangbogonensis]